MALVFSGGASTAQEAAATPVPEVKTVYCLDCHECLTPSDGNPCMKPCPYTHPVDGTAAEDSPPSPDFVVLDLLSDLYEPVVFDHGGHAAMSSMGQGCRTCHHYSPAGQTPPCRSCHGGTANPQNLRQPGLRGAYHRQCLNCHREWSHGEACEACHAERVPGVDKLDLKDDADIIGIPHPNIQATPTYVFQTPEMEDFEVTFHHVDHTDVFGLKCAECHHEENCGRCHDTEQQDQGARVPAHEQCARCHEAQIDEQCDFCHGGGERPRFNHAERAGFDISLYHAAVSCAECHGGNPDYAGLDTRCNSCHASDWQPESFDHARTGMALNEVHQEIECVLCHTEGVGGAVACDECHDEMPDRFPTPEDAE